MAGRTRPPYPPEFRQKAVRLVRSTDKPVSQIADELGVSANSLRNWVKQADSDAGARDGLTTDEREELRQLRRDKKRLEMERDILKKATAFFARDNDS
jgi:transposase-like protein